MRKKKELRNEIRNWVEGFIEDWEKKSYARIKFTSHKTRFNFIEGLTNYLWGLFIAENPNSQK